MKKRSLASLLLLSTLSLGAAQSVAAEQYRLPNGLNVVLHVDKTLPVTAVNVWYRVGSKDEVAGRSGFAHLFEHLMFMGTRRAPNFDTIMESGGGSNNASTSRDRTNYYSSGPSSFLPTLLWLEADRMEALGASMTQEKLGLQRDVVKNERRQRYENSPYGLVPETLSRLLYPANHPYYQIPIGTTEDIDAATVDDVKSFFQTYYVPSNASLVVAGDFDPAVVKPLIARLFGDLPGGRAVTRKPVPPVNFQGVKRTTLNDRVQAAKTVMAWHSPALLGPGDAELDLASLLLSDGVTSRLYQKLVVETGLASDVSAYQQSQQLGSVFVIDATLAPGKSQDELEAAIDGVLRDFSARPVDAAELRRQVEKYEFATLSSLQSVEDKADSLNAYAYYFGQPDGFKRDLDRYRNATPEGVRATAARVLTPQNRVILRVVPQTQAQAQPGAQTQTTQAAAQPPQAPTQAQVPQAAPTAPQTPRSGPNPRDQRPADFPQRAFTPPAPTEFTLSNGIRVQYWQRAAVPLVSLQTVVRGGSELDTPQTAGRASMLADMLDEGAGNLDARGFQSALDELGAQFGAGAARRFTTASLSVTAENLSPALRLYADALTRPRFDEAEFARVQRVDVQALERARDNAGTVASIVSQREFFGQNHPYGRPLSGYAATVRNLRLADVKALHARLFQPQNAAIFAAGSLRPEEFRSRLEQALGTWRNTGAAYTSPTPPAPANRALRVLVVDKPGAPQTVVRFLMPAPPAEDARSNALRSLNTLLGGSFTSRLQQNLREDKGYTYGAGSGLLQDVGTGYLVATANVETGVTGPAVREFLNEFARLRRGDVTADEAAKTAATRRADTVASLGTLEGLVGTAAGLYTQGKPFSALGQELEQLSRFGTADLNRLAPAALPYEQGVLVLVGDRAKIVPQLQGLNLPAPVEVKFD
ncbi:M16 family metallopeptidase [Deinococcus planocerae]|uniref:M16 family metallopeptidase n=1 Tax=Deinococcus planocerae TaxID=1737569 RepID=UPI000C7E875E|nr:pitrilysin family protein [Deinococcus planocerae]